MLFAVKATDSGHPAKKIKADVFQLSSLNSSMHTTSFFILGLPISSKHVDPNATISFFIIESYKAFQFIKAHKYNYVYGCSNRFTLQRAATVGSSSEETKDAIFFIYDLDISKVYHAI